MASAHGSGQVSRDEWIHELARVELNPEAESILGSPSSFDPRISVEESTLEFQSRLQELIQNYSKVFNAFSDSGKRYADVKVFPLAQTASDFMLFRNQTKLVISKSAHGVIEISYSAHQRGVIPTVPQGSQQGAGATTTQFPRHEIVADVGPFFDVRWMYHDREVTPEQVAKFFFADFIRATREQQKSKTSNHLLMEQFKAFLQEKGLEL
jgi:hypothetical protein